MNIYEWCPEERRFCNKPLEHLRFIYSVCTDSEVISLNVLFLFNSLKPEDIQFTIK